MRITMPELDIKLYEEGFEKHDKLDRADLGKQLSELVEKIEEPLIIALNSSWGNGKTHFLKCWVGAHKIENDGKATTIYFDAFKNDYLDDPLIALTDAIIQRKSADNKSSKAIEALKKSAPKLARVAVRVVAAVATAGASEIVGTVADSALNSANSEFDKASEDFWKKEDDKRAAMAEFEKSLIVLTKNEDGEDQKIVIVINELDRCRPDYALSVLETMKHFFQIPNVHFVLGVNLHELKNSVRARYGSGVDADIYLQKFINITILVPDEMHDYQDNLVQLDYFYKVCATLGVKDDLTGGMKNILDLIMPNEVMSLRGVERLVSEMALASNNISKLRVGYRDLCCSVLVLKVCSPLLFKNFKNKTLTIEEIIGFFKLNVIQDGDAMESYQNLFVYLWSSLLAPEREVKTYDNVFGQGRWQPDPEKIYRILNSPLNTISINK